MACTLARTLPPLSPPLTQSSHLSLLHSHSSHLSLLPSHSSHLPPQADAAAYFNVSTSSVRTTIKPPLVGATYSLDVVVAVPLKQDATSPVKVRLCVCVVCMCMVK